MVILKMGNYSNANTDKIIRKTVRDNFRRSEDEDGIYHQYKLNGQVFLIGNISNMLKEIDAVEQSYNDSHSQLQLNLGGLQMNKEETQELIRRPWSNLSLLSLAHCELKKNSRILIQAKWPNLKVLFLQGNDIGKQGCKMLGKSNWINLEKIYLSQNKVENKGCRHLSKVQWKNLKLLNLGENKVRDLGCQYLSRGFDQLSSMHLQGNRVREKGCSYLSQGSWNIPFKLVLNCNQIGVSGFRMLVNRKWQMPCDWEFRE